MLSISTHAPRNCLVIAKQIPNQDNCTFVVIQVETRP